MGYRTSEVSKSSTWRELKAVALALEAFVPRVEGKSVKIYTDNQGVPAIIQKGNEIRSSYSEY